MERKVCGSRPAPSRGQPIFQALNEGADPPELCNACFPKASAFKCPAKSHRRSVDQAFLAMPQIGSGSAGFQGHDMFVQAWSNSGHF
jgi:hypothetical protein